MTLALLVHRRLVTLTGVLLVLIGLGAIGTRAAPGWPVTTSTQNQAPGEVYSATLYAGACGDLDVPTIVTDGATAESGSDATGWSYSFELGGGGSLSDLTAAAHVIAVDIAEGDLVTTVVCGELAGDVVGNRLVIGLTATETGELTGLALVTGNGDEPAAIKVYVILAADGSPLQPGEDTESDPDLDVLDDASDDEDDSQDDEQVFDDGV